MMIMICLLSVIGATLGSFTVATASRLIRGQTPWQPPRSYCDYCYHWLTWWQLIPIAGWIVQRGQCHWCHHRFSCWSTLCEVTCAFTLACQHNHGPLEWVSTTIVLITLTLMATTDHLAMFIWPISLFGLLPIIFVVPDCFPHSLAELISSLTLSIVLFGIQALIGGIGLGDDEFLTLITFLIGWKWAVFITFVASLIVLGQFVKSRDKQPFVPALAFATATTINLVALWPSTLALAWL